MRAQRVALRCAWVWRAGAVHTQRRAIVSSLPARAAPLLKVMAYCATAVNTTSEAATARRRGVAGDAASDLVGAIFATPVVVDFDVRHLFVRLERVAVRDR